MKKSFFLSIVLILGLSLSSSAQTKEAQSDYKFNVNTINSTISDTHNISQSLQIKPYKFNQINLDGPRIIVIDGKLSEHGFNELEPKDIQSFSVVKSEKVSTIYGNKDASAVIIITTKKGVNGTKVENELNKK